MGRATNQPPAKPTAGRGQVKPHSRSCAVCADLHGAETIEPCFRCKSTLGHRHVQVIGRDGAPGALVAACDVHAPSLGTTVEQAPKRAQRSAQRLTPDPEREAKRRADRERRLAQRRVLDRHADEYQAELETIRAGDRTSNEERNE